VATSYQLIVPAPFPGVSCLLGARLEDERLVGLDYLFSGIEPLDARTPLAREVAHQLKAYFRNPAYRFELPMAVRGTPFQRRVWSALKAIPAGERRTYGALARKLGSSPRAVGGACRTNPIPIIIPCHRVVSATGPGGYAGHTGGRNLEIKQWLLSHEAQQG